MVARARKSSPSGKKTSTAAKKSKAAEVKAAEVEATETATDLIEEAQIADTAPAESTTPEAEIEAQAEATPDVEMSQDTVTADAPSDQSMDPEDTPDNGATEEVVSDDTTHTETEPAEPIKAAEHPVPVPVEPEKSSGFWPMVFGGLVAGGIGFAIAELDLLGERDPALDVGRLTSEVEDQAARIANLEGVAPDMGPVDALASDIETLKADIVPLSEALAGVDETLAGYEDRIAKLEARPIAVSPDTGEADAYAEELARLQASVEEQRNEIQGLLDNALSVEEAASQAAKASTAQAALARVTAAIAEGQPFDSAVSELQALGGVEVPEALVENASGVATLADLQARFPDTARAALATARANAPQEEAGGLGSFLKRQLGARSVAPREGNDADAVLSRAEDAVRGGRLSDALTEIVTLPDAAQGAMQDWLADAQARDAAQAAADELAQRLTAN